MKILIACEFSGIVRDAFIKNGHQAISCDLLPSESQGPHIQGDVLKVLNHNWDALIAFPPCTYIAVSANRWLRNPDGSKNKARLRRRLKALVFIRKLLEAPIPLIALENPISHISGFIRKPDQIIHPYQFGSPEHKSICLWLKGFPLLIPTKIVIPYCFEKTGMSASNPNRSRDRSRFFKGVARGMADQWGPAPAPELR